MTLLLNNELAQAVAPIAAGGYLVPTPQQITALVDSHERYTEDLRQRMESDWELAILTPFDAGEGYREYTSNEPMTYFSKITSALSSGKIKIRIPVEKARREKRERESAKERFIVGILKAADERLARLGQPSLQDQLAGFIDLRGWYCGRMMLVKDLETEETYVDITPWDPLHVSWGMGRNGLKWVCHKTKKTRAEIADEYPGLSMVQAMTAESYFDSQLLDDTEGLDVYDWYDQVNNIVVVENEYAKLPALHTPLNEVPVFFGHVGPLPLIQSRTLMGNVNLKHQGESIFAANRRIYEKLNLVMSTMLQLVALSRDHAFTFTSLDGTKTAKKNIFLEGSQTPLAVGESIDLLPLLEMSKDTGAFLGLVSAEIQRGALPYSTYGQLAFQLSGYAVNLLKQATDAPITPRKQAMENAYRQIANSICDQFATGAYDTMHLQGWTQNRDWFDQDFTPDMMVGLPSAEVKLVVATPQDDMQKIQMATMLRDGVWPTMPDRWIWDEILNADDTDSIADQIKEQVGERLLPEAALMVVMQAMEKQGRPDMAMLYQGKLIQITMLGQVAPPGTGADGQQKGKAAGYSPEGLSAPEQGAPRPQPTPQSGPIASPGSPRPGAQGQP